MGDDVARCLVDALYAGTPTWSGCRVNHARGLLVEGRFTPTAAAQDFCSAATFAGPDQRLLARFSSSTGNPDIAEDDPGANPRGLAIAIGDDLVLVGHSIEAFPARTPDEFLAFIEALTFRRCNPERLDGFMRDHAAARHFVSVRPGIPESFASLRYHMLHAFRLISVDGCARVGRLTVTGLSGHINAPGPQRCGDDQLTAELRSRLASSPVELLLEFIPARDGDSVDDITAVWPDRGGSVLLGRLFVERVGADQGAQRSLVFDPSHLPDGISFAGDPMVDARVRAYRFAAQRRTETE